MFFVFCFVSVGSSFSPWCYLRSLAFSAPVCSSRFLLVSSSLSLALLFGFVFVGVGWFVFSSGGSFLLTVGAFYLQLSFFAYSPLRCWLDALCHCKQRSSTVSKKAPIVSKRAPIVSKKVPKHNCKQRSSTVRRKLPTVSQKAASRSFSSFLMDLAHQNRSDFCELRLRCPSRTPEILLAISETLLCDLRVRWKVAGDLRFLRPKPLSAGFLSIWLRQRGNR